MKKLLILILPFILACGIPISATVRNLPRPSTAPTPPPRVVEMRVVADALNIRAEPDANSAADANGLQGGQVVHVYTTCTGGFIKEWVSINPDCTQWVNSRYLEQK